METNDLLKSLERMKSVLTDIQSAKQQVEKTVNSYDGLNSTTSEYVSKLGTITTMIQEVVDAIGKDYSQKVKAFEKDRETIINESNVATKELSNATEVFKDSLFDIQTKLKYCLIVNMVLFIAIGTIIFLLLK